MNPFAWFRRSRLDDISDEISDEIRSHIEEDGRAHRRRNVSRRRRSPRVDCLAT
jgi:hypothetical protein